MGPEKRFWTIQTSSWGFKTLRIFLEGSRPHISTFLIIKNHTKIRIAPENSPEIRFFVFGFPDKTLGGPMGPLGGPLGEAPIDPLFPFVDQ